MIFQGIKIAKKQVFFTLFLRISYCVNKLINVVYGHQINKSIKGDEYITEGIKV